MAAFVVFVFWVLRGRHKVYEEFVAHVINTASSQDVLGNHFNGHHSSLDSFLLKNFQQ